MSNYTTEIVRVIWDDKDGVALRVGPDADSLGLVEIRTYDAKSEEWYGKIRLALPAELAVKLGHALIAAVEDPK